MAAYWKFIEDDVGDGDIESRVPVDDSGDAVFCTDDCIESKGDENDISSWRSRYRVPTGPSFTVAGCLNTGRLTDMRRWYLRLLGKLWRGAA